MTFSPLETILISAGAAFISALAVRIWLGGKFVCQDACAARHRLLDSKNAKLFTGMKLLVLYSKDVPEEKKSELLSEGSD